MGNFIVATYDQFVTYSSITATTEDASWPVSNVQYATWPNRVYKSSAAAGTAQRIIIDFGVTTTLQGVMIDLTNVTSVKVQGNATSSWTSPTFTATATVSQDPLDGRYKLFQDLSAGSFASTGYRFLSIQCNTSSTTFGGTPWWVGSIIPLSTITTADTSPGPSHGRVALRATDPGLKVGGGGEPSGLGNLYCRIVMPAADLGTAMQSFYDALNRNGEHQPVVFYRNLNSTAETYCAHKIGTVRVDTNTNHINVDALVLEEYV